MCGSQRADRQLVNGCNLTQTGAEAGIAERLPDQPAAVCRVDSGADDRRQILAEFGNGAGQLTCLGSDQAESPVMTSNCLRRRLTTSLASSVVQSRSSWDMTRVSA